MQSWKSDVPNPNEKLVKVFGVGAGIGGVGGEGVAGFGGDRQRSHFGVSSAGCVSGPGRGDPAVREEDAEAASALIAEQRQAFSVQSSSAESEPDDDSTAEIAIIEEPPAKG